MKKSYILGLAAIAAFGLASCQDDQDPKISTATEFVLNTPPLAEQTLDLTPEGTYTFSVSQPNYGLTLAPTYGLQVSLKEDFTPLKQGNYVNPDGEQVEIPAYVTIPLESQLGAVLEVKQSNLASAICAMRGIGSDVDYTDEPARPLYVRATSIVNNQPSTAITSNVVALKYVKGYCAFEATVPTDVLYNPGNANGWDFGACMQIAATEPNKYQGYIAVDGGFKFTHQPSWTNPGNYGAGKDENLVLDGATGKWTGRLVENGGDFKDIPAGLYMVNITLTNTAAKNDEEVGTVELTPINSIGIIGDFNGWGGDVAMTPEPGFTVWKAENVDLGAGSWKFRMNGSWDYNLGGTLRNLTQGGGNISDGGVHTVVLDLSKLPYSARFE